MIMISSSRG